MTRNKLLSAGAAMLAAILFWPISAVSHGWKAPAQEAAKKNPQAADAASVERGKKLFEQFCALCHGALGRGDGPAAGRMSPPPADLVRRAGHHSDGDFFWKIAIGRGTMPGFKDRLSEEQTWDVVNFIQRLKGTH